MVHSHKLKGVHQHPWGSWVAEIRHPLLKKRVRLGTFDTVDEAARVHDQAAVILCGRSAKTNFPVPQGEEDIEKKKMKPSFSSSSRLSQVLHTKLKRTTKTSSSPSLTCLRLDTKNALIGVWQNRAGATSESKWVTSVKLGDACDDNVFLPYKDINNNYVASTSVAGPSKQQGVAAATIDQYCFYDQMDEQERITLQMIEELLSN